MHLWLASLCFENILSALLFMTLCRLSKHLTQTMQHRISVTT
jgi:hypothetical protein